MRNTNARYLLPLALIAALAACTRDNDTATTQTPPASPAPSTAPATTPPATPAPAPASTPLGTPAASAVSVTALDLGNAVGADNRVGTPMATFARTDTIYAAVSTSGAAPSSTIAAKWTYQDGQVVGEESKTVAPTGTDVTTFSVSKPDGWPAGKYKVEITIDGQPAATREFDVT